MNVFELLIKKLDRVNARWAALKEWFRNTRFSRWRLARREARVLKTAQAAVPALLKECPELEGRVPQGVSFLGTGFEDTKTNWTLTEAPAYEPHAEKRAP